jgi:hypothetical protein
MLRRLDLEQGGSTDDLSRLGQSFEGLPMQSSATLLDYLTTWDIGVFLGVPLCLLAIVLVQNLLAGRAAPRE